MNRVAIPLHGPRANGRVAWVSPQDAPLVSQYTWRAHTYRGGPLTYARANVNGKYLHMHRLLLYSPPLVVDHIDGDGLNNTRENIELVTMSENMRRANFVDKSVKERKEQAKAAALLAAANKDRAATVHELAYYMRNSKRLDRGLKGSTRTAIGGLARWTAADGALLWSGSIADEASSIDKIAAAWLNWMAVKHNDKLTAAPKGDKGKDETLDLGIFHGRQWVRP